MKKHHILTLALILIASVGFGQYNLNYPDIKIGNSATGKIVLNGSNLQMPRIGLGSVTDSVLTIVNGVVKKVPRSQFATQSDLSNYIATNNGTGNNTSLNTPSITNGSANNMTVGLTSPTTGRFTNLTATTTATVPTVVTSDNSTNAASTAHVKANLLNYAKLNGGNNFRDPQFIVGDTAQVVVRNNSNTSGSTIAFNFLSLRNSVGNGQLTWGNLTNTGLTWQPPNASGILARVEDFATGQTIGANTTGNASTSTAPQNATSFKTALATSLQDVTSVGNFTTNDLMLRRLYNATQYDRMSLYKKGASYAIDAYDDFTGNRPPVVVQPDGGLFGVGLETPTNTIDVNGTARIRSLSGTGSAPLVADANGVLSRGVDNSTLVVPVSGTSQAMTANRIYIPHSASLTTFTLPTTATEGQLFQIVGEGPGGWRVSQNSGQQIVAVNASTTSGTGGYIQSSGSPNCTVTLRCTVANTKFTITSSQGTINTF